MTVGSASRTLSPSFVGIVSTTRPSTVVRSLVSPGDLLPLLVDPVVRLELFEVGGV